MRIICLTEKWVYILKIRNNNFNFIKSNLLNKKYKGGFMKKKSIFKVVSFILVAAIILGTFAGCGFIKKQNQETAPTDTSGFTYYESSDENIVTDDGVTYVNNEVLVYLNSEADKPKLEKFLSNVGGKIVGELPKVAEYQVLLNKELSCEDMNSFVENLESQKFVLSADFNYAFKLNSQNIPNDKEWKNEWSDTPVGKTWAMDAINARQAWDHVDEMQDVNVGIIDSGFDLNHKDLHFEETPYGMYAYLNRIENDKSKDENDPDKLVWSNHGTHVAGTIGASFNNKIGVAGVAPKAKLYGVSMHGLQTGTGFSSAQCINVAIYYLIADKNCKVVNVSMGLNLEQFCANRHIQGKVENPYALQTCKNYSESQEKILQVLIDRKYPFVICTSSGNENDEQGCCYYKKDSYDPQSEFAYYSYHDYNRYEYDREQAEKNDNQIVDNEVNNYFERHKDNLESVTDRDGHVDAGYSCIFDGIEDEDLKNRIIVVGAVGNNYHVEKSGIFGIFKNVIHDGFSLTGYSNCGSRVDILAPGGENSKKDANNKEIYSTVANNKYDTMYGTSMASPHVAGAAAVLFSLKPDLAPSEVKRILCGTATGSYSDPNNPNNNYKLLNIGNAVEELLEEMLPETTTQPQAEVSIKDEIIKRRRTLIDAAATCATCAIAVKKDGKVICTEDFSKPDYPSNSKYICGDINTWSDIVEVSLSPYGSFAVGLRSDGTVVALGDNKYGQCNVTEWTDIVKIDTTETCTAGLKKDGTVVFTNNEFTNIMDQKIKDIRLSGNYNLGIGAITEDNIFISEKTADNHKIIFEETAKDCISFVDGIGVWAGIKEDGTVVSNCSFEQSDLDEMRENWLDDNEDNPYFTKEEIIKMRDEFCNPDDYCFSDVTTWKNVVSVTTLTIPREYGFLICGYTSKLIGITLDGTVLTCGSRIGVEKWTNISSISIEYDEAVGITKDGHGISTDPNSVVNTWTDLAVY